MACASLVQAQLEQHHGNGGQTVGGSFGPTGATHIIPGASQFGGSPQSILFVAAGQPVSIG